MKSDYMQKYYNFSVYITDLPVMLKLLDFQPTNIKLNQTRILKNKHLLIPLISWGVLDWYSRAEHAYSFIIMIIIM